MNPLIMLSKMNVKNIHYFRPVFGVGSVVSSLLFSAGMAFMTRKIPFDQVYRDIVVGDIAWTGANKSVDYYMVLVFLISFVVALFLLNVILHLFGKFEQPNCLSRSNTQKAEDDFDLNTKIILTASIPAGWWIGAEAVYILAERVRGSSNWTQPPYEYLMFSLGAVLLGALIRYGSSKFRVAVNPKELMNIYIATLLNLLLLFFALLSLSTVIAHGFGISFRLTYTNALAMCVAYTFLVLILAIALYTGPRIAESLKERLTHLLFWLQLPLPLLLFILNPSPYHAYEVQPTIVFHITLLILIIICLLNWRRQRSLWIKTKSNCEYTIESGIVRSSIVCILIFMLRTAPAPPSDDYHLGEWILPWQQMLQFGKMPFVDLNYPHGMVHLIHGFLSWVFFDGTAASFGMAGIILLTIGIAVTYFVLSGSFGPLFGLLIMVTSPFMRITEQQFLFIVPSLLILMHPRLLNRATLWLTTWVLLSFFLVFYTPSTGIAFALATIPAAVWVTLGSMQEKSFRLKWPFLVAILVLLGVMGFTSIGSIVKGLIVFLLENSYVNTVANGIPWKPSLIGFIGLIWTVVVCALIVLLWREFAKSKTVKNGRAVLCGVTVLCFLIAMMPYSMGRIDYKGISRAGQLSLWAVYFGLPLMVLFMRRPASIKYFLIVYPVVAGAIYAFNVQGGFHNVKSLMDRATGNSAIMTSPVKVANRFSELPNLGVTEVGREQWEELLKLKKLLGRLLRQGETFLDLTNRSARYFYLGYPVPVLEAAFYNAPATKTQLRILEQIKRDSPPVVLAESGNIYFDGGPSSLRANLLYRHFVLSYVPLKLDNFIILVEPERAKSIDFDRNLKEEIILGHQEDNSTNENSHENSLFLLDRAFRVEHLKWIPISWGRSWKNLSPSLRVVGRVDANQPMKINDVQKNTRDGTYDLIGNDPQLIFDTSVLRLKGSKAAYVSFNFHLSQSLPQRTPELEIRWKTLDGGSDESNFVRFYVADGKVLVPLDCNPRWLLSDRISELKIGLKNCQGCGTFSISDITFFMRNL